MSFKSGLPVRKLWKVSQVARIDCFALFLLIVPGSASAQSGSTTPATPKENPPPKTVQAGLSDQTFTLVGAGDIATCKHLDSAEATAKLIEQTPGTVFAAGDLAYEKGSPMELDRKSVV